MAYMYCDNCWEALDSPNAEEIVRGAISCDSCGEHTDLPFQEESMLALVTILLDRIEALETKVTHLEEVQGL